MFKQIQLYLALAGIVAVLGGLGFHKHVVHQRDDARAEVVALKDKLKASDAAVKESERLRGVENQAAKDALTQAGKDADARVAEARRSAGAIKKIVEKPHAKVDPVTSCPVSELVPAGELRDALQPHPFGEAAAPVPGDVPVASTGAPLAGDGWALASLDAGGSGGDGLVLELGLGGPGVGPGFGEGAGSPLQVPGL